MKGICEILNELQQGAQTTAFPTQTVYKAKKFISNQREPLLQSRAAQDLYLSIQGSKEPQAQ